MVVKSLRFATAEEDSPEPRGHSILTADAKDIIANWTGGVQG